MARPSLAALAALGLAALTASVVGCSIAFDLDREQCQTTDECSALGFDGAQCIDNVCVEAQGGGGNGGDGQGGGGGMAPLPENFACLDGYMPPDPGPMTHHTYRFELATAEPGTPPMNGVLLVCRSLDAGCATPELTLPLDAAGIAEFDLPSDFQGFMSFTADNTMATLVFFQEPVVVPPKEKVIRVVSEQVFTALAGSAGVEVDPTKGVSVLLAHDCNDDRAAGVRFTSNEVDEETVQFHFVSSFPDPDATETDAQGAGGYVNMPLGNITVQSTIAATGRVIGENTFFVRANTISYVPIGPTVQ